MAGALRTEAVNSEPTADVASAASSQPCLHLLIMAPDLFQSRSLPHLAIITIGRSSKSTVHIAAPLASREHARLYEDQESPFVFSVEDVGSANGTQVRGEPLHPGERVDVLPGEAIVVGSTVIMISWDRPIHGLRRALSHDYFECRLEDECARAGETGGTFALGRLRFARQAEPARVLPVLFRHLAVRHLFAPYGPRDYEILFLDVPTTAPDLLLGGVLGALRHEGLEAMGALACYPRDGRSSGSLFACAHRLLDAVTADEPKAEVTTLASTKRMHRMASRAALSSINILILGETGTGKKTLARLVHELSARRGRPFLSLACGTLNESLFERELFGPADDKGAPLGILDAARGGTVFLDDVSAMPLSIQTRLLRLIEWPDVHPRSRQNVRPLDVRFLSSAIKDQEGEVAKGSFRRDLFYRLNGTCLVLPPLRERADDLGELANSLLAMACRERRHAAVPRLSRETIDRLMAYRWPGNLSELKSVLERALVLHEGTDIRPEHLPLDKMELFVGSWSAAPVERRLDTGYLSAHRPSPQTGDPERVSPPLETPRPQRTQAAPTLGPSRRAILANAV